MGKSKLDDKIIKEIIELRQRGYSLPEIGKKTSVGKSTAFRYIRNVEILPEYRKTWRGKWGGSLKKKLYKEEQIAKETNKIFTGLSYRENFYLFALSIGRKGAKAISVYQIQIRI